MQQVTSVCPSPRLSSAAFTAPALLALAMGCAEVPPDFAPALGVVAGDGAAGFADGADARFRKPIRLAAGADGAVVVADIYNHSVRRVLANGRVETLAGHPDRKGHADGPAAAARFASPHGVAVSPAGVIAVAEAENHTIRLLTPVPEASGGTYTVSTLAGQPGTAGFADGPAGEALFESPHAVLFEPDGALLVADIGNASLRRVRDGAVETVVGADAGLTYLMDIALAPDGSVVLIDAGTGLIHRWREDEGLSVVPLDAELATPHGVAVAPDGTIFVAELDAHRVVALVDGHLVHVAGTGVAGAGPRELNGPAAVLVSGDLLWIADLDNHRLVTVPWRAALPAQH